VSITAGTEPWLHFQLQPCPCVVACRCGTIGFYAAYWFVTKIYGECSWGGSGAAYACACLGKPYLAAGRMQQAWGTAS